MSALRTRVWCSPRLDMGEYPWNWSVDDETSTLEFGREKTEEDARTEAKEALESWNEIFK